MPFLWFVGLIDLNIFFCWVTKANGIQIFDHFNFKKSLNQNTNNFKEFKYTLVVIFTIVT